MYKYRPNYSQVIHAVRLEYYAPLRRHDIDAVSA